MNSRHQFRPALPLRIPPKSPRSVPPTITECEKQDHNTRMQILNLIRISSIPSAERILSDYTFTRKDNAEYKMITTASFIALSLVKQSRGDVVAVCLDRKPGGLLNVEFSLNEATPEVVIHANTLKDLCKTYLNLPRTPEVWVRFRTQYLETVVKWGRDKVRSRLCAISGTPDAQKGKRQDPKAAKIFSLSTVKQLHLEFSEMKDLLNNILERCKKSKKSTLENDLARGDIALLKQCETQNVDLYSIVSSYLSVIENHISIFYRGAREEQYDGNSLFHLFTACDILGTSDMFHEILDVHGVPGSSRDHFTRSLRKVGQYSHGTRKLYRSLRKCKDGVIKDIVVTLIPSPSPCLSHCHADWYEFIQRQAKEIIGKKLSTSKATIKKLMQISSTNQSGNIELYRPDLRIPVHCELTLAISRLERGIKIGEIGVSKDCCLCCYQGISALNKHGVKFGIRATHGKISAARLTGNAVVDRRMIEFVKNQFEEWIRSLDKLPDSDAPSSAETSYDYAEESIAETTHDEEEFLKFMFDD